VATHQPPKRFRVAFSYAGEQVELVRGVALEVARGLGEEHVFLAEWWEHYLAGGDADLKLQEIYDRAIVVVVCASQQYGDKAWTRAEHAAIRSRLMRAQASGDESDKLGVLPVRVGEGGLPFNTIIPDIRSRTHREAAELIFHRLALIDGEPVGVGDGADAGFRTHVVEAGDSLDRLAARYLGAPTEWRRLAVANALSDPLAIGPGQVIVIPDLETADGPDG
jgi:hypothetical protein